MSVATADSFPARPAPPGRCGHFPVAECNPAAPLPAKSGKIDIALRSHQF